VGWDHSEAGTWPLPDDVDDDLNRWSAPGWIEEAGRRARGRLLADASPAVVGHVDWEAHNLAWHDGRPGAVTVHDWDSVATRSEAAIAGAAAAVFPSLGSVVAASLAESARFLAAYEAARSRPLTPDQYEVAWAAGLWVLAYNARKESTLRADGPYGRRLHAEAEARLSRSGG
jgi:hypothetical protein